MNKKKQKEPERLNRIQEVLTARKVTQQALSIEAKIGFASVNAYYHGKKEPSLETLKKMADALEVKGGDLLNF